MNSICNGSSFAQFFSNLSYRFQTRSLENKYYQMDSIISVLSLGFRITGNGMQSMYDIGEHWIEILC